MDNIDAIAEEFDDVSSNNPVSSESSDDEDDVDTLAYTCDYRCGFRGNLTEVVEHEKSCSERGGKVAQVMLGNLPFIHRAGSLSGEVLMASASFRIDVRDAEDKKPRVGQRPRQRRIWPRVGLE